MGKRMDDNAPPNVTIVTAMVDLGRAGWSVFPRSLDDELAAFANLAALANPMVIHASPHLVRRVAAIRDAAGHADLTWIVPVEDPWAGSGDLLDAVAAIMADDGFRALLANPTLPRFWHPHHAVLRFLTPQLVLATIDLGLVQTPLAAWVDADHVRRPEDLAGAAAWRTDLQPGPMHRFAARPADLGRLVSDLVQTGQSPLTGEVAIGSPEAWEWQAAAFDAAIDALLAAGLVDDDATLALMASRRDPTHATIHDLRPGEARRILGLERVNRLARPAVPMDDQDDLRGLLRRLRVHRPSSRKIRLGATHDGGYVIPTVLLDRATRLLSIGIGDDTTFEEEWFSLTRTPVFMYDGSVGCGWICGRWPEQVGIFVRHDRRHVGNEPGMVPLEDVVRGMDGALLKMDAEGAEYGTLARTDLGHLSGIVLEVHHLALAERRRALSAILDVLLRDFVLVHVHGNNCCPCIPLPPEIQGDGDGLPDVLELTFVNRDLHGARLDPEDRPLPDPTVDGPNFALRPELRLGWVNRVAP